MLEMRKIGKEEQFGVNHETAPPILKALNHEKSIVFRLTKQETILRA